LSRFQASQPRRRVSPLPPSQTCHPAHAGALPFPGPAGTRPLPRASRALPLRTAWRRLKENPRQRPLACLTARPPRFHASFRPDRYQTAAFDSPSVDVYVNLALPELALAPGRHLLAVLGCELRVPVLDRKFTRIHFPAAIGLQVLSACGAAVDHLPVTQRGFVSRRIADDHRPPGPRTARRSLFVRVVFNEIPQR